MDFIQTANKQADKFGPGKHGFQMGNSAAGILATALNAAWCDGVQQELINLIEAAGLAPSGAALDQVLQGVKRLAGGNVKTITAAAVALTADDAGLVLIDASVNNVSVTLPAADAVANVPLTYEFVRLDATANAVTVTRAGTDSFVGGATSFSLDEQADYRCVRCNGLGLWTSTAINVSSQMPGEVVLFARSTPPSGFLKANGAAVSRTAYAKLFAAIGTTYGVGDGSTTFNLPDARGEFLRCWDDGRGVDSGRGMGSWQDSANKRHEHGVSDYDYNNGVIAFQAKTFDASNASGRMGWNGSGGSFGAGGTLGAAALMDWITTLDNDYSGESRPRNVALLACIKY